MKNATFLLLAFVLALAGCSGQDQSTPQSSGPALTAAPPAETPAPAAVQPAKPTSPERIAEIEASGQTGMWATVTEVCPKDIKTGLRTMLVWNVKESGAQRVILYVVDANGGERNFGQGDAVGEKESGPWLRPGLMFRIRNYETKDELGTLVIGEKTC